MKLKSSLLVVRQLDRKFLSLMPLSKISRPSVGWVRLIRTTLNMSLKQLGEKMGMTPQSVRDIEMREVDGTITLNTLQNAAKALNMKFVYGFIPIDSSLEKMIEQRAHDMASDIVKRTSITMKLENQENSEERIKEAIDELAGDIKREMPKKLWD